MSVFEIVQGVEGCCLILDDERIAGPKPWGGGRVVKSWTTRKEYGELVRCKDCAYNAKDTDGICYRFEHEHFNQPNGFCAWGKRREEGETK